MRRWLSPRFGAEAAFLFAAAALLYLLEASRPAIVAGMFVAWLIVAALEILGGRRRPGGTGTEAPDGARPDDEEDEEELHTTSAGGEPELVAAEPEGEPGARPVAGAEPFAPVPEDADEHEDEDREPAAGESRPAREGADGFPPPPPPPVLTAVPAEPEPAPEPEPEREPEPAVVELHPAAPREWNVWELERLARERSGGDAAADEERSYLLLYLREFATPDGALPPDFDRLVRESFGDLIATAR